MTDQRVPAHLDRSHVAREAPFQFSFEGRAITAYPGETLGAALAAAHIRTFRTTRRYGRPRGLFCGIGICFDCLLVVDGVPNQRACVTRARPDMQVHAQRGAGDDLFAR